MKIFYGLKNLNQFSKPVLALGVFDGVHAAHIHILKSVARLARRIKGTAVVLTFWPHPQKEGSLYSLEHRLRLIAAQGIDVCIVINFNRNFSAMSAEDFIRKILGEKIGARYIYIGKNFRFGKNAAGDFKLLKKSAGVYKFKVKTFPLLKINHQAVSSSNIRRLILQGRLKEAEKLLSRPVGILGTVVRGVSLGKKLGYPTANINPHHEVLPPAGIYAVKVFLENKNLPGLCYIGSRPTFVRQRSHNIEVYIFDFKQNIYGKYLEIKFIEKIRGDRKFSSPQLLVQQIQKDVFSARKIFSLPLNLPQDMPR